MSGPFFLTFLLLICFLCPAVFPLSAQYAGSFGETGAEGHGLKKPVAITFGATGNLYVTDAGRNSVVKFSPEGRFLGEAGGPGSKDNSFDLPAGISRRTGFGLFVCDLHNDRLVQLNEDLSVQSMLSLDDKTPDNTFSPFAIAASRDGSLYAADPADGEVLVLEKDGRIHPLIGKGRAQPLVTLKSRAIAVLADIYMDDAKSGRIYAFDRFGTFLRDFGRDLIVPDCGLAAVNDTLLGVADKKQGRILFFSANGVEAGSFSTFDGKGAFTPGAFCNRGDTFFILKPDPPAVVVMRVRF